MEFTKKNKRELFGRFSKYLEDLSKLVIAGVVLSSITKEDIHLWWLIGFGTLTGLVFLYGAYMAFLKSKS